MLVGVNGTALNVGNSPTASSIASQQSQTKRMKKRRELDALMKPGSRASATGSCSPFTKDSTSLLMRNSQSSTEEEEEITSNPQRSKRNGTVVTTKSNHNSSSCPVSLVCSTFIFTICFLITLYLLWQLVGMQRKYDDVDLRLRKLESDVNTNKDALAKLTLSVQPVSDQLINLSTQVSNLEKSLLALKAKVPQLESRLDELSKLSTIETSFETFKSNLASNINALEAKMSDLQTNQNSNNADWQKKQEKSVEEVRDQVDNLKTSWTVKIDSNEAGLTLLKSYFSGNVSQLSENLTRLTSSLTTLESASLVYFNVTTNLNKELTVIKNSIESNDHDVKSLSPASEHAVNQGNLSEQKSPQDQHKQKAEGIIAHERKTEHISTNSSFISAGATPHRVTANTTSPSN